MPTLNASVCLKGANKKPKKLWTIAQIVGAIVATNTPPLMIVIVIDPLTPVAGLIPASRSACQSKATPNTAEALTLDLTDSDMNIPLKDLLLELHHSKLVKVTGSWADGTQTEKSDIDLMVKDCDRDTKPEHIEKIKIIFIKHTGWIHSNQPGHIWTICGGVQIEASYQFSQRLNRLSKIKIEGVEFKTY